MKIKLHRLLAVAVVLVVSSACAPEIKRKPVDLTPASAGATKGSYVFTKEVTFSPASGYPRTIAAGSRWQRIGRVPQGDVLRPVTGVFTVESANVSEAGLVISQDKLTGFYMLVERSFAALEPPVAVQLVLGVQ